MTRSKSFRPNPFLAFIFLFSLFFFHGTTFAQNAADDDPTGAPGPVQYVLEDIKGDVQVLESGSKDWAKADEGEVVETGDEVKLGAKSEATLTLGNDTSVHLDAMTDMKVEKIEVNEKGGFLSRLQVMTGNILADVKKHLLDSQSSFEVESNGVICGVRGTAFEVNAQGENSQVITHEGSVEVANGHESHLVEAGHLSNFQRGRFLMQRRLGRNETQRFQRWRAFRQIVFKKRLQRLQDIRDHRRAPWKRRHPFLKKVLLQKQFKRRPRH